MSKIRTLFCLGCPGTGKTTQVLALRKLAAPNVIIVDSDEAVPKDSEMYRRLKELRKAGDWRQHGPLWRGALREYHQKQLDKKPSMILWFAHSASDIRDIGGEHWLRLTGNVEKIVARLPEGEDAELRRNLARKCLSDPKSDKGLRKIDTTVHGIEETTQLLLLGFITLAALDA
jgi:hypothetical protein